MHHNINMFTTGNTHLKYRKHRVHSAAHKLKIRSSRLVLTTAGTDLDSTDRAAIGGAKNSSASEPLKRPILSLWNSRVLSHLQVTCGGHFFLKNLMKSEEKKKGREGGRRAAYYYKKKTRYVHLCWTRIRQQNHG